MRVAPPSPVPLRWDHRNRCDMWGWHFLFYESPAASSRHQCFSGHPAPQLELCKERDCFSLNVSMKELP